MEPLNSDCPSCGREIGSESKRCIFCGAERCGRKKVAHIRLFAFLLFIMAGIYIANALHLDPTYHAIFALDKNMNFQKVRVKGKIISVSVIPGKYDETTVVMTIAEEIGEGPRDKDHRRSISLKAEGKVGSALIEQGLPGAGAVVDVSATLYAGDDYRVLSLGSPQLLRIISPGDIARYREVTIDELVKNPERFANQTIAVKKAEIVRIYEKYQMHVSDVGEKKSLVVFGVDPKKYRIGDLVSIQGSFAYYNKGNYWEIKIKEGDAGAVVILLNKK